MAVHLTRIYTQTGDDGTTALGDMSRVRKTDPRVGAYADCDETNAAIGVALALGELPEPIAAVLGTIQNDLFDVGADLCTPVRPDPEYPPLRVEESYVDPPGGLVRRVQRRPAQAGQLHPARRHARRRAAAPGPHAGPPGRAQRVGALRGRSRGHQPAGAALPEPALGPAVHPRPRARTPTATSSGSPVGTGRMTKVIGTR